MKPEFHNGEEDGFLARIRARLPDMHRAERKLGEFLLDFPGELASYDAQELARLSGVSKATVSRFVRRIGFENYEQARQAARDESRTGSRLFLGHAETETGGALEAALQEERDNIAWTFERIPQEQIDEMVDALFAARKVWIVGYRISQSFATYLSWQLIKLVDDIGTVPKGGESLGEHIASMQPGDLVIHFALRRRMGGTEAALREIRETGARLALISDDGMPRQDVADWHFRYRCETRSVQFNHAAVLTLCHWIMLRASDHAGAAGRQRLRQIDEINERLGEY